MIEPTTLTELRLLAEAATPGEWAFGTPDDDTQESRAEWTDGALVDPDARAAGSLWVAWVPDDEEVPGSRIVAIAGDGPHARADAQWIYATQPRTVLALLDAAAEHDALRDALATADATIERLTGQLFDAGYRQGEDRAEIEALRSQLAGRCLSDVTHRDEEHRQSFCMLPAEHAPLAHDDCMGCTWTDADHWQPAAVDRLADELRAVADESQHEGWDSPAVRRVVDRLRSAFEEPRP